MTQVWSIDAETHSEVDLRAFGADVYSRHAGTRCLMLAFHPVGHPDRPRLWIEGDPVPYGLIGHIANGGLFAGWNVVGFDRLIYSRILVPKYDFPPIDNDNWRDSMHLAAHANLPRSLDGCGSAVGVPFDNQLKDTNRIRRITDAKRTEIPVTVRAILDNPAEYSNKLVDDLQWLAARCVQDVEMEEQVLLRLPPWPNIEPWLKMPAIDRRINDRGVMFDRRLVAGMRQAATSQVLKYDNELAHLTDDAVDKTTKVEALKQWVIASGVELPRADQKKKSDDPGDVDIEDDDAVAKDRKSQWRLRKSDFADLLARKDIPENVHRALEIRAEASKISIAKLRTMEASATSDDRLYQALVLGGAQQTLRWAGARWNVHNFPRDTFANYDEIAADNGLNSKTDGTRIRCLSDQSLMTAIEVGRLGDPDLIRSLYETAKIDSLGRTRIAGPLTWISRMLRRTLCAPEGSVLLNGDYSQIEARITAWLSGQQDVLDTFARGEDLYRMTAAAMEGIALSEVTYNMRQRAKAAVLALGFGGGPAALVTGAFNVGLIMSVDEAQPIVRKFRQANSFTQAYWYATDDAAANAVKYPGHEFPVAPFGRVSYMMKDNCLRCRLPCGRELRYWQPRLVQEYWDDETAKDRLSLYGLAIKGRAVFERSLYHTILVENQVQGIAADALGTGLGNLDAIGMPVNLHVHDEIAAEETEDRAEQSLGAFKAAMLDMPAWSAGLPMAAACDHGPRFG